MHEMGTVMYVIRAVNEVCEENKLTKVASVTLEIGEVSGIIPSCIKDFWQWAIKKEKYLQDAELIIEPIKAVPAAEIAARPTIRLSTPRYAPAAAAKIHGSKPATSIPSRRYPHIKSRRKCLSIMLPSPPIFPNCSFIEFFRQAFLNTEPSG